MAKKNKTADIVSGQTADLFYPPALSVGPSREILKKPVEAVHMVVTGGIFSKTQRLAFNAFLKKAHEINSKSPEGIKTTRFEIERKEFSELIGFTSGNRKFLKDTLTAMQDFKVQWDILHRDGKTTWESCVLIPRIGFTTTHITYTFDEQILETLMNPTVYSRIDLGIQRKFNLSTSAALYEWCNRFRDNPAHKTSEMDWEKWRWAIHGEVDSDSAFNEYKFFKRDKVKPAMEEINRLSDLKIELIENKQGTRRVKTLCFLVEVKEIIDGDLKPDGWQEEWSRKLNELGIKSRDLSEVLRTFNIDIIEAHYVFTLKRLEDKTLQPLKSPGSYFLNAIKFGYANDSVAKQSEKKSLDNVAQDIAEQFSQQRNKVASELFLEISDVERENLIIEYNEQIEIKAAAVPKDPTKRTKRDLAPFFAWYARKTWGEPKAQELLDFAVKSGALSVNRPKG